MEVDCTTVIAHSTCTGGVCSCADGYTEQNGNCKVTPKTEPGNKLCLYSTAYFVYKITDMNYR